MRELRFRAWHKEKKKISYGYDEPEGFTFTAFDQQYFIPEDWYIYELEIMQSTGLKDKNGKEIFEGDVVSLDGNITADDSMGILPNGWTFDEESVFAIVYDQSRIGFSLDFSRDKYDDVQQQFGNHKDSYIRKYKNHAMSIFVDGKAEIIGNIYQNPELLK